MQHHAYGNQPTQVDVNDIQALLDAKTRGIPVLLLPQVFARQIVHNPEIMSPKRPDANIDEATTLAGFLRHHGTMMLNEQAGVPKKDWDFDLLLALFCSNVDKQHSFDRHFKETRFRALKCQIVRQYALVNKLPGRYILDTSYVLACHEAWGLHSKPGQPTFHRENFVRQFKKFGEYYVTLTTFRMRSLENAFGKVSNRAIELYPALPATDTDRLDRIKEVAGLLGIQSRLVRHEEMDFDAAGENGDSDRETTDGLPLMKRKKHITRGKAKGKAKLGEPEEPVAPAFKRIDKSRFEIALQNKPILSGLLEPIAELAEAESKSMEIGEMLGALTNVEMDMALGDLDHLFNKLDLSAMSRTQRATRQIVWHGHSGGEYRMGICKLGGTVLMDCR
ncbi:hypothetical protein BCR34DRAFT_646334 [Clohesyomyces aquaticus]|uniref:Uncharacterized protein n=1 Tax=Clohesyomyces aquaticus TaxID=1231657 RepID=A0A1Y1Y6W3_9PLEO|nr:hypothetical protein BCR34DRAFT_646334 [Clohesyomyces aquaticus]